MLKEALKNIKSPDKDYLELSKTRIDNLIKPKGSLGKLEEICAKISSIQKNIYPEVDKKSIIVFAADHGIFEEGVAITPRNVTLIQAVNMTKGLTGVCALAKQSGSEVVVVDVGIDSNHKEIKIIDRKLMHGTNNFTKESAMNYETAVKSIEVGIEMAYREYGKGVKLIGVGEMGIGNTTPSSAITAVFGDYNAREVTWLGANLPMERLEKKISVVEAGIRLNRPNKLDPIDVLSKVGGLEIGAMAGAMIGAASKGMPVVIDGFICTVAAIIATKIEPKVKDYIITSHYSMEKGAKLASEILGIEPSLKLDLRLGEGSGAAVMFNVIDSAICMNKYMVTFDEGGFSL
ncbi:MAG: nicotinate-nucleotide--dimethylbenzimidazole phosphoribosyltransferase [Acidaminobacteraceae bacterium]